MPPDNTNTNNNNTINTIINKDDDFDDDVLKDTTNKDDETSSPPEPEQEQDNEQQKPTSQKVQKKKKEEPSQQKNKKKHHPSSASSLQSSASPSPSSSPKPKSKPKVQQPQQQQLSPKKKKPKGVKTPPTSPKRSPRNNKNKINNNTINHDLDAPSLAPDFSFRVPPPMTTTTATKPKASTGTKTKAAANDLFSNNTNNNTTKLSLPLTPEQRQEIIQKAEQYIQANVKMIAACQDEQITIDCSNVIKRFGLRKSKRATLAITNDGGAATSVLLKLLYKYANNPQDNGIPTYVKLLRQMRGLLSKKGYPQVPTLTSSRPITLEDEFQVMPTSTPFSGTRRALIIGINYTGNAFEIPGCHNDCYNMMKYLKTVHGYQEDDFTILMDDGIHTSPTRENITKAFHRFAWSIKPGDAVFMHYAGHGSTQIDESGDESEKSGGMDSTLLPLDFQTNGVIVDDEIFRILLVPLPKGVDMTVIMDCCHSGTILDLPFEYIGDLKTIGDDNDNNLYNQDEALANVHFPHWDLVHAEQRRMQCMKALQKRASQIELAFMKPPTEGDDTCDGNNKKRRNKKMATLDTILDESMHSVKSTNTARSNHHHRKPTSGRKPASNRTPPRQRQQNQHSHDDDNQSVHSTNTTRSNHHHHRKPASNNRPRPQHITMAGDETKIIKDIDEEERGSSSMEITVEQPKSTYSTTTPMAPKSEAALKAEEASNCLLGCCLLCLNPIKLFKVLSS